MKRSATLTVAWEQEGVTREGVNVMTKGAMRNKGLMLIHLRAGVGGEGRGRVSLNKAQGAQMGMAAHKAIPPSIKSLARLIFFDPVIPHF